jgi:ABC-type Na+ efflux pump permease subunit
MSEFRQAALIARRDFRLIVWRREGIAWIFVMPIVFFYFIGMATGGFAAGPGEGAPDPLALDAPESAGLLIDQLVQRLEEQNFGVVRSGDAAGTAVDRADAARADAANDAGGSSAISRRLSAFPSPEATSTPTGSLTEWALTGNTIELRYTSDVENLDATFDQLRIARAVYTVLADAVAIDATGGELDAAGFAALAAAPRALTLDVRPAGRREVPPAGFSQTVPGVMVMFVMLIALTGSAIHLVIERRQGLLRRLASAPVSRASVIAGKVAGRALVAFVQVAIALVVGTWMFQVDWGPALAMVVVILAAWALFNAALAVLFGNLVRTEGQASGIGVMVSMTLAALGGAWWPIEIAPDWMQTLALFIPTGWAMDAMHKLVNFAYGPASVLPHLLVLLATTAAVSWAAARTFRYS